MPLPSDIEFVRTRNFTPGTPGRRRYDLIVIHTMEFPEIPDAAERVARYFQTTDRKVSAHYCIDSDSIVQCVQLSDVAWCAPGANHNGIQLEHSGYARQGKSDWRDPYSSSMLELSADLSGWLCGRYQIPIRFVGVEGLKRGDRGITTHDAASKAFRLSTHWDPGPNFPMEWYLGRVRFHKDGPKPNLSNKPWPVPIPKWFWEWARWYLGEGEFKGQKRDQSNRPPEAPVRIPEWAWRRLNALLDHRRGL